MNPHKEILLNPYLKISIRSYPEFLFTSFPASCLFVASGFLNFNKRFLFHPDQDPVVFQYLSQTLFNPNAGFLINPNSEFLFHLGQECLFKPSNRLFMKSSSLGTCPFIWLQYSSYYH